jgi:hypothetical protein
MIPLDERKPRQAEDEFSVPKLRGEALGEPEAPQLRHDDDLSVAFGAVAARQPRQQLGDCERVP